MKHNFLFVVSNTWEPDLQTWERQKDIYTVNRVIRKRNKRILSSHVMILALERKSDEYFTFYWNVLRCRVSRSITNQQQAKVHNYCCEALQKTKEFLYGPQSLSFLSETFHMPNRHYSNILDSDTEWAFFPHSSSFNQNSDSEWTKLWNIFVFVNVKHRVLSWKIIQGKLFRS